MLLRACACSPRYKLLLQELIKHTPDRHPDYHNLTRAVGVLSVVCCLLCVALFCFTIFIHFCSVPLYTCTEHINEVAVHINELCGAKQIDPKVSELQKMLKDVCLLLLLLCCVCCCVCCVCVFADCVVVRSTLLLRIVRSFVAALCGKWYACVCRVVLSCIAMFLIFVFVCCTAGASRCAV